MSSSRTCAEHTLQEIRFHCDACNVFVCDDCVSGEGKHTTCKKSKLNDHNNKQVLIESIAEITEKDIPRLTETMQVVTTIKGSFNESVDETITKIRSKTRKIKTIFHELQEEAIRQIDQSRHQANVKFEECYNYHHIRCSNLQQITRKVQQQNSNIQPSDVVKLNSELQKMANNENNSENIPNIEPPSFEIEEKYLTKEFYQDFFQCKKAKAVDKTSSLTNKEEKREQNPSSNDKKLEASAKETNPDRYKNEQKTDMNYDESSSDIYVSKSPDNGDRKLGVSADHNKDLKYKMIKMAKCENTCICIVPKTNIYEAWVIGVDVNEVNLNESKPIVTTLLSRIDGEPFSAGHSQKHGLLIGRKKNRKTIKLLKTVAGTLRKSGACTLVSHIKLRSEHLAAICTVSSPEKDRDIAVLTESNERGAVIRWYSDKKIKTNELNISNNIKIENPVFIDESVNGNICITCDPNDKSSWIQLLDKHGNHKMRYPPKDEKTGKEKSAYSFIGAGFLRDGRITVLDRVCFRQHLLDQNGNFIKIDQYQNQPSSFAVDIHDNIWIGFYDGTVQVMEYDDGTYEEIN
ncbi:uncharacterized protein LOC134722678 [Mytilus trossulus]|uniref:uncharacterized protein LOC134722678 n=1 Tax=Mytilus trossulus TaxID=6551 RepID=UPI0030040529